MKRFFIIISLFISVHLMGQGNLSKWDNYKIAGIDTIQLISMRDSIYNPEFFRSFDSIQKTININNTIFDYHKYIPKNFAQMVITSFKNDTIEKYELSKRVGLPAQCTCMLRNDSLLINLTVGFFSGFGNTISIKENRFTSNYFEYMDDMSTLKLNLLDSAGREYINLPNKTQELKLERILKFQNDEEVTGILTATSGNFYEINYKGDADKRRMKLITTFKCRIAKL
jgi:hypothetical protein